MFPSEKWECKYFCGNQDYLWHYFCRKINPRLLLTCFLKSTCPHRTPPLWEMNPGRFFVPDDPAPYVQPDSLTRNLEFRKIKLSDSSCYKTLSPKITKKYYCSWLKKKKKKPNPVIKRRLQQVSKEVWFSEKKKKKKAELQ